MKRLFVIFIIIVSVASGALAQQSVQREDKLAQVKNRLLPASNIQSSDNTSSRATLQVIATDAVKIETPFYVKDGKVYIALDSLGVMMPMTGGGAGMCFSVDLKNRIEALKRLLVRFPR